MMGKWLQLLKQVAPSVTRVAVIFNPDTPGYAPLFNRAIQTAATSFGIMVTLAPVLTMRRSRKPSAPRRASPEAA